MSEEQATREPPQEPAGTGAENLRAQRIDRAEQLRGAGLDPYPPRIERTHANAEVEALLEGVGPGEEPDLDPVAVAGRVVAQRGMGRATFLDVLDGSGRVQALLRRNVIGEEAYERLKLLDLGDFVAVRGTPMRTRTGEATVGAASWQLITKALRAPPEKFHGLTDVELRQRRRYLDLMANEEARDTFRTRSRIVAAVRRDLDGRGFLEVETPVLQEEAGGRRGAPLRDALRGPRRDPRPPHQPRTAPQAPARRRLRARLRDRAHLPQRGLQPAPQPRIHHAGAVPGLRRLRDDGDARGGAGQRRRAGGAGDDGRVLRRRTTSTSPRPGGASPTTRPCASTAASTSTPSSKRRRCARNCGGAGWTRPPGRAAASSSTSPPAPSSSRTWSSPRSCSTTPSSSRRWPSARRARRAWSSASRRSPAASSSPTPTPS